MICHEIHDKNRSDLKRTLFFYMFNAIKCNRLYNKYIKMCSDTRKSGRRTIRTQSRTKINGNLVFVKRIKFHVLRTVRRS